MIHIPIQLQSTQEKEIYFVFHIKLTDFYGKLKRNREEKGKDYAWYFLEDFVPSGNYLTIKFFLRELTFIGYFLFFPSCLLFTSLFLSSNESLEAMILTHILK